MFGLFKKKQGYSVKSPCDADTIALKDVNDPTFSQEMLGKGIALQPQNGHIASPVNGTVSMVFPTGHAFGVVSDEGVEVLVHIGIDTVNMKGDGFTSLKKQGDQVAAGDAVIEADLNRIKEAGYDPTIMVVITNTQNFSSVKGKENISAKQGDEIITVEK